MTPALRYRVLREWQPFARHDRPLDAPRAQHLERLIPTVMKSLGLKQRLEQSQVFYLWPQIVGADVAKHAQPVALKNGNLILAVDHPIWLQELKRHHKALLLQKVRQTIGAQAVKDIIFRIG
jgi:predicted nucleic acid-binding Zn ribbon protein